MLSDVYMSMNDPGTIIPFDPDPYYSDEPYEDEEPVMEPFYLSDTPDKLNSLTLSEIYDLTPTDDLPIIDGLLYPGVYILAGAPKIGKSFLAAQIAFHVSRGIDLFGHRTHQAPVLYLALEDSPARLQRRFGTMFGYEDSENLHLAVHAGTVEGNLMDQLTNFKYQHPDLKLIIIDTLVMVKQKEEVQLSYTNDYKLIGKIKQFADMYGVCILMIHHTRKMKDQDQFNMISGTNGLFGAADGAWIMQKENRNAKSATLLITGRDQSDARLSLVQDSSTLVWNLLEEDTGEAEMTLDPVIEKVGAYFSKTSFAGWSGSATELKDEMKVDDVPVNTITKRLNANRHLLKRKYGIKYDFTRSGKSRMISLMRETNPGTDEASDSCDSL